MLCSIGAYTTLGSLVIQEACYRRSSPQTPLVCVMGGISLESNIYQACATLFSMSNLLSINTPDYKLSGVISEGDALWDNGAVCDCLPFAHGCLYPILVFNRC
jgi:hypothetical protein